MRVMVIPVIVGALGTVTKSLEKTVGIGNQMKNKDHTDDCIINIRLNIRKRSGHMKRLAAIQISGKKTLAV